MYNNLTYNSFSDVISLSIIGLMIFPFILYIITLNIYYIYIFIIIILIDKIIVENLKILFSNYFKNEFFNRPNNAYNCNFLCNDGDQGNKPGMPSGHMTITCFILSSIYYQVHLSEYRDSYLLFSIIYILLMAYSRYTKHCHNILQIISGIISGIILGILISFFLIVLI
jgi:membrane-associated phospholipid phosphatase